MPSERSIPSSSSSHIGRRRRSNSLNRDGRYNHSVSGRSSRDLRDANASVSSRFGGVAPSPLTRSKSARSRRNSNNSSTSTSTTNNNNYNNNNNSIVTRKSNDTSHQNRALYGHFTQSSPTLSMSSNGGTPSSYQQSQHQRFSSRQQQQYHNHHQHHQSYRIHAMSSYSNTSHESGSKSGGGGGGGNLHPSQESIISATPSRGDSSEGGSVHSAPLQTHRNTYPASLGSVSSMMIPERRDPPSTIVKLTTNWKKKDREVLSLPPNHKQMAKTAKRVIDELKRAADSSCTQEKRIAAITNACAEFDHLDEARHNVELHLGAAAALRKVLAALPPSKGNGTAINDESTRDDEIRMIAAALEMVFRGQSSFVQAAFDNCGNQLLPLLLRLLERAENGMRHADVCILNMSKVILYLSRVVELRVTLARQPGMLEALQRVSTSNLNPESRVIRVRIITNLLHLSDENKELMLQHEGFLDSLLRIAHLDTNDQAREYAALALMDLASAPYNQEPMAKNEKLLGTLCKMVLVETMAGTRDLALTTLQSLAFTKNNRLRLVSFKEGIVLESLKKALSSDKFDKARRSAAGALTNLACDETALVMGTHKGLLEALALVSSNDESIDVQTRASMALTKLAASITAHMSCFPTLLDALVVASLSSTSNSVTAIIRVKARDPENRIIMANHKGIVDTLADTCINNKSVTKDLDIIKDRDNAIRAIMHLANESKNCKTLCTKPILDALVQGASITDEAISRTKQLEDIRDSAIRAIERLATDFSNRAIMASHDGLLVAIAQATEREHKLETAMKRGTSMADQLQSSHPFLAKPLLMSLLVAL
ncbi:hypothetical protein IV203_024380 [Nitzschia inconspicua]|uniref:Uncharacterized protein n=1 Tax=Nitzschia inconspicua TaxID=303405 RepID=A0A9K3KC55_9STRA|nr:hypothetical protein IV203_024380 [Nitzschia inconspicua]